MPSLVPHALVDAYRATDYLVASLPEVVLRVDQPCPRLAALYARFTVASAAFLTACNPFSQALTREENLARAERLLLDVQDLGLAYLEGQGRDPKGRWPAENSLLILGISRETALELGSRHAQNALLWAGADATPRLLLLR